MGGNHCAHVIQYERVFAALFSQLSRFATLARSRAPQYGRFRGG
jgi:hypothetical protein